MVGIENRLVFDIDFGILLGSLLGSKFHHLSLTLGYTFENLCQGGSWDGSGGLLDDPGVPLVGSGGDFWIIFDHFSKVYQKLDWPKVRFLHAEGTMLKAE